MLSRSYALRLNQVCEVYVMRRKSWHMTAATRDGLQL